GERTAVGHDDAGCVHAAGHDPAAVRHLPVIDLRQDAMGGIARSLDQAIIAEALVGARGEHAERQEAAGLHGPVIDEAIEGTVDAKGVGAVAGRYDRSAGVIDKGAVVAMHPHAMALLASLTRLPEF